MPKVERYAFELVRTGPTRRRIATPAEAAEILDAEIRRYMEAHQVTYPAAFAALQQDRPALIEGYCTITHGGK